MAVRHAQPNEVISVGPLGSTLAGSVTTTLVKTPALEVIRLVVPAGKDIREHKTAGEITVQCLEGEVDFTAARQTQRLAAGQFLYLAGGVPHSLHGVGDASVLLTIVLR